MHLILAYFVIQSQRRFLSFNHFYNCKNAKYTLNINGGQRRHGLDWTELDSMNMNKRTLRVADSIKGNVFILYFIKWGFIETYKRSFTSEKCEKVINEKHIRTHHRLRLPAIKWMFLIFIYSCKNGM